jgi:hypothetical protein
VLLLDGCATAEDSPATPEVTVPPTAPASSTPAGYTSCGQRHAS